MDKERSGAEHNAASEYWTHNSCPEEPRVDYTPIDMSTVSTFYGANGTVTVEVSRRAEQHPE